MKLLLGQTNPTPGDWVGNVAQIQDGILRAVNDNADIAAFPELCIPGYLSQDLVYEPDFVRCNLVALQELVDFSRVTGPFKPFIIVGYVDRNHTGYGKPFRNMAAVIRDGVIIGQYQKWLLPYYDVFDEGRYFAPGHDAFVFEVCGAKWGVVICEDWWNDKGQDDYFHADNPIAHYRNLGVKNLVAINSSPYQIGKRARRISVAKDLNMDCFVFVNQRGGMDELVFDGNSFITQHSSLHHICKSTDTPHYETVSIDDRSKWVTDDRNIWEDLWSNYVLGIRDYVKKSGFKQINVGSSGGVDSALVILGACDAIGPKNVYGVRMPSIYSSDHSLTDAELLHKNLGCHDLLVPIKHELFLNHVNTHAKLKLPYNDIANENIQARLRANVLMHLSNAYGWLLLTTGNKTEATFGYCTLGGDMMGGFAPIKDLLKTQVYRLITHGSAGRVPQNIINKKPSAELKPGQFDEDSLLPYPLLDAIAQTYVEHFITTFPQFRLWVYREKNPPRNQYGVVEKEREEPLHPMVWDWVSKDSKAESEYNRLINLAQRNEFKRRLSALGLKFTKVAFGMGRRIPVVKK